MSHDHSTGNLLLCQQNAYLREGMSKVLRCEKKTGSENYLVILDNSVLYPEGGGQPYDLGTINGSPIVQVLKPEREYSAEELGGDSSLINPLTLVQVETTTPFTVHEAVECKVDWKRRYDFMQQHSAQHLFSAVADKLFHAETVGWSLGAEFVTVDLKSSLILTVEQLQEVEDETNRMIRDNHRIQHRVYPKEELERRLQQMQVSSATAAEERKSIGDEFACFRGEVKGAALAMSELRLVSIDGLDLNPCGGTHISSLSEINVFKIIGTEKDVANSVIKVRFLAGERAISHFHQSLQRETAISQLISSKPSDFVQTIDKMLKDKRDLGKKFDVYNDELAYYYGKSLLGRAQAEFDAQTGEEKKPVVMVEHRYGADLKFLIRAGSTVFEENKNPALKVVLVLSGDENVPVPLSTGGGGGGGGSGGKGGKKGGDSKKAGSEVKAPATPQPSWLAQGKPLTEGPFIIYGEADHVNAIKDRVLESLGGRGGGRPGRLQAYGTNLSNLVNLQVSL